MRNLLEIDADIKTALENRNYQKARELLNEKYDSLFEFYQKAKNPRLKEALAEFMNLTLTSLLDTDENVFLWKKMEEK